MITDCDVSSMNSSPAPADIVIVAWNAGERLRATLAALPQAIGDQVAHIFLIDNASGDGMLAGMPAFCRRPGDLTLITNPRNEGFGAASNLGAAKGAAPWILFLNPDVVLPPGFLAAAFAQIAALPGPAPAAIGWPQRGEDGTARASWAPFPRAIDLIGRALGLDRFLPGLIKPAFLPDPPGGAAAEVDQPMGACLMVRREAFAAIGGFDERFFVYYEDLDLCLRLKQAGGRILMLPGPAIIHALGGTTAAIPVRRLFLAQRSRLAYALKHFGFGWGVLVAMITLSGEPAARTVWALAAGRAGQALNGWGAWAQFLGFLIRRALRGQAAWRD